MIIRMAKLSLLDDKRRTKTTYIFFYIFTCYVINIINNIEKTRHEIINNYQK